MVTPAPTLTPDLIFDVGLHLGEDTAYYLRKGYRVVAFEANPELVSHCERRFAADIAARRLTIINGAISDTNAPTITFYRHPTKSVWGTTDQEWAARNSPRGVSIAIEAPVVNFDEALRTHGIPWYLKIDIEGADRHCLETLARYDDRPAYASIESEKEDWSALLEEFDLLDQLGFDRFTAVQQEGIHRRKPLATTTRGGEPLNYRFEEHASGPFGDDLDSWSSREATLDTYRRVFREYRLIGDRSPLQRTTAGRALLKAFARVVGRPLPGWYDTHAARSSVLTGA
jgi:FkbM family methyltransferase